MYDEYGRECAACGEFKAWSEYHAQARGLNGHRSRCKACGTAYASSHRQKNLEVLKERDRRDKAAKRADPEEKAKLEAANKRWRDRNKEYVTEKNRAYYQENKAVFKAYVKAYLVANPDKAKAWAQNYRARKRSAGLVTGAEIRAILGPAEVCFYCEEPFGSGVKTVDHIIPLCQGGANAVWNLVPCCKSCNSTKKHRTPAQWGAPRVGMARLNEKLAEHLSQYT